MNARFLFFGLAAAIVLSSAFFASAPNIAVADTKEYPIGQLSTQIYSKLEDEVFVEFGRLRSSTKIPCYENAIRIIQKALTDPEKHPENIKAPSENCPYCGLKSGGGQTCGTCGEVLPTGQTGVGTPVETLSYRGGTDPSWQVSGVIKRTSSANGEIDADVSIDITAHHVCKEADDEEVCQSLHAVVKAHAHYAESDDHKTVSDIKTSNPSMTIDPLLCCKTRPRLPYTVNWEPTYRTPTIKFGDKTLQQGEGPSPAPSAAPAGSPAPAASPEKAASAAPKSDPPINKDSNYTPGTEASPGAVKPANGDSNHAGNDHASLTVPSLGGSNDEIFGTSVADDEPGSHAVLISEVDANGNDRTYVGKTDDQGHFHFKLATAMAIGLATVEVVRVTRLLRDGTPAETAVTHISDTPGHLTDTQPVMHVPETGPAITEANSAYDLGPQNNGVVEIATRGTNPLNEQLLVDGSPIEKVAASSISGVFNLPSGMRLGEHTFQIASDGVLSNPYHAYAISEQFQPLAPMHHGMHYPLVLSVQGAPADTWVTLRIAKGATFEDGSTQKTVQVIDGAARAVIVAGPPGPVEIRSQLNVNVPGEWPLPSQ